MPRLIATLCITLLSVVASGFVSVCMADSTTATTSKEAARGKMLFLRCSSCHDIAATAAPKIGPNLLNVVNRKAGSLQGFNYSPAMKLQTFVWDKATLDRWLTNPNNVVPGTSMAFAGLPDAKDRQALIAFLSLVPSK